MTPVKTPVWLPLRPSGSIAASSSASHAPSRTSRCWGSSASGPVYLPKLYNGRNKTFWTYGYEGIHSTDPRGTLTTTVPTAGEKRGDFSQLLALGSSYQIYDPFTTTPVLGVNWNYGANFGTPINRFAFTTPRTFRISFGVRF